MYACVCACVCVRVCLYKCDINQNNVIGATCTTQYRVLILFRTFAGSKDETKMGNITLFIADTLMKSKIVLDIRKEQKLKYYGVALPEVTDRKHGSHIGCYQRFIALPKSQRKNYKDQLEKKLHLPLKANSTVVSTISCLPPKNIQVSSTGVFQKKSSFCLYKLLKSIIVLSKVIFQSNLKKTYEHMLAG